MYTLSLNEHRCKCGKLLLKGLFFDGSIEIKCKKFGFVTKIGQLKKEINNSSNEIKNYVLIINSDGIIINASDSACLILGYERDELLGKHLTSVNKVVPREVTKFFMGSVLNEENYLKIDTIHQTKEGINIPIVVFLKLFKPSNEEKYVFVLAKLKNLIDNKKILNKI